jgi:hypothetical protein
MTAQLELPRKSGWSCVLRAVVPVRRALSWMWCKPVEACFEGYGHAWSGVEVALSQVVMSGAGAVRGAALPAGRAYSRSTQPACCGTSRTSSSSRGGAHALPRTRLRTRAVHVSLEAC